MGVLVKNENPVHSVSSAHRNTRLGMKSNGRVDGRISVVPIREAQREVAGRGPRRGWLGLVLAPRAPDIIRLPSQCVHRKSGLSRRKSSSPAAIR